MALPLQMTFSAFSCLRFSDSSFFRGIVMRRSTRLRMISPERHSKYIDTPPSRSPILMIAGYN